MAKSEAEVKLEIAIKALEDINKLDGFQATLGLGIAHFALEDIKNYGKSTTDSESGSGEPTEEK